MYIKEIKNPLNTFFSPVLTKTLNIIAAKITSFTVVCVMNYILHRLVYYIHRFMCMLCYAGTCAYIFFCF